MDSTQNPAPAQAGFTNSPSVIQPTMNLRFLPEPIPLRYKQQRKHDEFPLDDLSATLKGAVEAIVDKVQLPCEIAASSVLAAASLAAQTHADIANPRGEVKPLSLFTLSVAASGERKSSADKLAMEPVRDFECQLELSYNSQLKYYKPAHAAWTADYKRITNANVESAAEKLALISKLGPEPVRPMLPHLTCSEPTLEGLLTQFQNGWPSMGIFSDEGSTFIAGHGMTDETRLRTGAALCSFWNGTPVDRVRKSLEESFRIKNRRLSLHLMVQPTIVQEFLSHEDLKGQGLFARCLIAWPESNIGTRYQHDVADDSEIKLQVYRQRLLYVFQKALSLFPGTTNELMPTVIQLDEAAKEEWKTYADFIEEKQVRGGEYEAIRDFASKMVENALRLAGVMTIIDNPDAKAIDKYMLWRSANLMEYYASQQLRIFNDSDVDEETRNAELLLNWLQNDYDEDHVTMTEIQHDGPHKLRVSKVAAKTIQTLQQHNWLVDAPPNVTVRGRRVRGRVWIIQR